MPLLLANAAALCWTFAACVLVLLGSVSLCVLPVPGFSSPWAPFLMTLVLGALYFRLSEWRRHAGRLCGPDLRALGPLTFSLAVLALGVWAAMGGTRAYWHARFSDLERDIRAQGHATSLAALRDGTPDSALSLQELSVVLERFDVLAKEFAAAEHPGERLGPWSASTYVQEAAHVMRQEPFLLKELAPVLAKGYSRYTRLDFQAKSRNPTDVQSPQYSGFVELSRVLRVCAGCRAYRGELDRAWDHVRLSLALSNILANEPVFIGRGLGLAARSNAVNAAVQVMLNKPTTRLPPDIAEELRDSAPEAWIPEVVRLEIPWAFDLHRYLERVSGREWAAMSGFVGAFGFSPAPDEERDPAGLNSGYFLWSLFRAMGLLDMNFIPYLKTLLHQVEPGTWSQLQARKSRVDADAASWRRDWRYLVTGFLTPWYGYAFEKGWTVRAWSQMAALVAELGASRGKLGRFPNSLSDLSVDRETLLDPFSEGNIFLYAASADGRTFELCSAGPGGDRKGSYGQELCVRQTF